jgi:hypothetical protein
MPQQIGGGMSMQEKIMFSAMESCSFKCLISGVGGRYSYDQDSVIYFESYGLELLEIF